MDERAGTLVAVGLLAAVTAAIGTIYPIYVFVGLAAIAVLVWAGVAKPRGVVAGLSSAALFLMILVPYTRVTAEWKSLQPIVAGTVLALALVAALASDGRIPRPLVWVPLGFFLVLLAFASVFSPAGFAGNNFLVDVAVPVSAVLIGYAVFSANAARPVARFFVAAMCAEAVYAVIAAALTLPAMWRGGFVLPTGSSYEISSSLIPGTIRAQGTFGHALVLSFMLGIAIALVAYAPAVRNSTRILVVLVLCAGLIASGSRGSLLIAAAVVIFAFPHQGRVASIIAALFTAAFAALFFESLIVGNLDQFSSTGSYTHRVGALNTIGNLLFGQPVAQALAGNGSGSTPYLFNINVLQTDGLQAVDNQAILTLAQSGVVGVLLLGFAFVAAILNATRPVKAALIVAVGHGLVFDTLDWPVATFTIWALLAYGLNRVPAGPGPPWRIGTVPSSADPYVVGEQLESIYLRREGRDRVLRRRVSDGRQRG